jgi:CO dehydrogenase maturation factor
MIDTLNEIIRFSTKGDIGYMSHTIAFAGKGGTGKTTLCGLLIDYLGKKGKGPILAVDADANSNLNEVLGEKVATTLGDIREEVARAESMDNNPIPASMSKSEYMDFRFGTALIESDNYDLIVMGRTQGKGCYCYVNDILKSQIDRYSSRYNFVVVDNEAGMEHVSRGILPAIDTLFLVSDCSRRGIQAVGRIAKLAEDLKLNAKNVYLIVNHAPNGELNDSVRQEIDAQGLQLIGVVPYDPMVYDYDAEGTPTVNLPEDALSKKAMREIIEKAGL